MVSTGKSHRQQSRRPAGVETPATSWSPAAALAPVRGGAASCGSRSPRPGRQAVGARPWCSTFHSTVRRQRHGCAPRPPANRCGRRCARWTANGPSLPAATYSSARTPRSSKRQPTNWAHTVHLSCARTGSRPWQRSISWRGSGRGAHRRACAPTSTRQASSWLSKSSPWRTRRRSGAMTQRPTPAHLGLPDQGASTNGATGQRLARLRYLYRLYGTPLHEEVLLNELLQDLHDGDQPVRHG